VNGTTVSSVAYAYDAMGRLLLRTAADGTMVRYYYDGTNTLLERQRYFNNYDGWRWWTLRVYTLAQAAMGQIAGERTMTAWHPQTGAPTAWSDRWYHYDMLGNVTGELDASGLVQSHVWMEAFGTVLAGGQVGRRLTTKTHDADAGLYYFSARWYNPSMGQFINESPFASYYEHAYNLAEGNPLIAIDPTGLYRICCRAIGVGSGSSSGKGGAGRSPAGKHCWYEEEITVATDAQGNPVKRRFTIGGQNVGGKCKGVYDHPLDKHDNTTRCTEELNACPTKRQCLVDAVEKWNAKDVPYYNGAGRTQNSSTFLQWILRACNLPDALPTGGWLTDGLGSSY